MRSVSVHCNGVWGRARIIARTVRQKGLQPRRLLSGRMGGRPPRPGELDTIGAHARVVPVDEQCRPVPVPVARVETEPAVRRTPQRPLHPHAWHRRTNRSDR